MEPTTLKSREIAFPRGWRVLPTVLLYGLVLTILVLNVVRIRGLGMDAAPPFWVVQAIPAAVSQVAYQHPLRYTALRAVEQQFTSRLPPGTRSADAIDAVTRDVASLPRDVVGTDYVLLGPDDKGIVDLVAAAFHLFGYQVRGVMWLYLIIQAGSVLLLCIAARRRPTVLALVVFVLVGQYLILPMVRFNGQLDSLLALRALPELGLIACLHSLLFAVRPSTNRVDVAALAIQVALMVFVVHLRSTAQWELLLAGGVAFLAAIWQRRPAAAIPLLAVMIGMAGLQVYRAVAYPAEYQRSDQILTRVFWHNIASGLVFSPAFAEREQARIDDRSIIRAVGRWLVAEGRSEEWVAMHGPEMVTSRDLVPFNRASYDRAARDFLVSQCQHRPTECLQATTRKFGSFALLLGWYYGWRDIPPDLDLFVSDFIEPPDEVERQMLAMSKRLDEARQRAVLWSAVPLSIALIAGLCVGFSPRSNWRVAWLLGGLGILGSCLPIVVGYPAPWTMVEAAVMVTAGGLFAVASGIALVVGRLMLRA